MREKGLESKTFTQIATAEARDMSLSDEPAVYAWYRELSLGRAATDKDLFLKKLDSLLQARLSDKFQGRVGTLYEVAVQESSGPLTPAKGELLKAIAEDVEARNSVARLLSIATTLQAPLYVGKARNLKRRVGEHVDGSSELRERLRLAGIPLESCILRYCYMGQADIGAVSLALRDLSSSPEDTAVTLLEDLISRLGPAAFVRRRG